MELITTGQQLNDTLYNLITSCKELSFAVAWASKNTQILKVLLSNKAKIKYGVIGTHFFQTDYEVLESFIDDDRIHFMLQPSGIFHPKAYVFWTDKNNWNIIIGSANMTKAAFEKNEEICIHFSSDDSNNKICNELKEKIEALWKNAEIMTEDKAHEYKIKELEARKKLLKIKETPICTSNNNIKNYPIITMDWTQYLIRIKEERYNSIEKRCYLLKIITDLFKKNKKLINMNPEQRCLIAGLPSNCIDNDDWGWFGNMTAVYTYYSNINNNNKFLSRALDYIPSTGKITLNEFKAYIKTYLKAFPNGYDGKGTFSRLLAMKRPDYFVCINEQNIERLSSDFNINEKLFNKQVYGNDIYLNYWNYIVLPIINSSWWKSNKPKNKLEKQIWQYRAAMLDTIYYSPKQ